MKPLLFATALLTLLVSGAHARQSPALTARLKPLRTAPLQPQSLRSRLSPAQTANLRSRISGFARKQALARKRMGKTLSDTEIKAFLVGIAAQTLGGSGSGKAGKPTGSLTQELQDAAKGKALTPELRALAQRAGSAAALQIHASKAKQAGKAAEKAVDAAAEAAKGAIDSAAETASDAVDYAADVTNAVVDWLLS